MEAKHVSVSLGSNAAAMMIGIVLECVVSCPLLPAINEKGGCSAGAPYPNRTLLFSDTPERQEPGLSILRLRFV